MIEHSPSSAAVQVVIVAWNSGVHLQRALDALERQTFRDFEVVVWDNASADGAVERLRAAAGVRIVRAPENLGFAAANNRAAALSRSAWIAALNPDAFPEPGWLQALLDAAQASEADAVASLQLDDADPERLDGAGDAFSVAGIAWRGGFGRPRREAPRTVVEVFAPCAAAALYRREAFEAVGGFDERYFCYFEDVDLGARLRARGGRVVFAPEAVVRHVGSASAQTVSGFAEYHGARNRLWTFAKVTPRLLLPVALPAHLAITAFVVLRSPDRATRRARLRGLRDAWRGLRPFLEERPRWRPASLRDFARALSWSPLALRGRRPVWRPLEPPRLPNKSLAAITPGRG
jgi:GT2 family glycosyltransferase